MKIKFTILFSIFLTVTIFQETAAQNYYWSSSRKIPIIKDNSAILMKVSKNSEIEQQLTKARSIAALERINSQSLLIRLESSNKLAVDEISLISNNRISLFKSESGHKMIPTGEILFKPKKGIGFQKINSLAGGNLSILKEKYGCYRVFINNYENLLSVSNRIYESGLVEYCHPNFIMEITKNQNDILYPDQYYLNNTGQFGGTAGIDINAPQAWNVTTGLHNVRVAVIDDGVENHLDIDGRVLNGFTPVNNGNGAPGNDSAHGQACAGIIAASMDNNNEGIAGITPCADIIPINIFAGNETTADYADAIDWAWDNGNADVISNSWGYTAPNIYHDNIANAIGRARTQGRGGDGSIVVFASGNANQAFSGVTFPATVSGVVTVGAVDNNGNIWNYSSRGSEMDLVAPSGDTNNNGDVRTTDREGVNGYNNGNYTNTFGGTSAACPQVAGVAALMLSVNPGLTESQIVSILKNTATDMGTSGFDNTFGYGRLNAQAAINAALPPINGDDTICSTGSTFSINNLPSGANITWSNSSNLSRNSSQGANPCTFSATGSGSGWIQASITSPNSCGNPTIIRKNVDVGVSSSNIVIGNVPSSIPVNTPIEAVAGYPPMNHCDLLDVQWRYMPNSTIMNGSFPCPSNNNSQKRIIFHSPGTYYIQAKVKTSCGWSNWSGPVNINVTSGGYYYSVFPNPASTDIFVSEIQSERVYNSNLTTDDSPTNIKLELYDFTGNTVRNLNLNSKKNESKLDVSGLPKGNYFLRIVSKEVDEVHQILIE